MNKPSSYSIGNYAHLFTRLGLGGIFILLGWNKTQDPVAFLKILRQFDVIPYPWLMNAIAAWLPWFEMWCGVLLILGIALRTTALLSALMFMAFIAVILKRAIGIAATDQLALCAVQFDCGCGSGVVKVCYKILQNCVLTLASLWLFLSTREWRCIRPLLFPARLKVKR